MNLNDQQREAVYSDASRILCLAGAGSGKTFVLISRILRLVDEGVDPRSILALTFTNAAAFEMLERFNARSTSSTTPEFKTFHAFCYSLIASDKSVRLKVGYAETPGIATDEDQKRIRKEAALQLGIKISDKKLSGKVALTDREKQDVLLINKAQLRLMKQKNLITFDEMCRSVCRLFSRDDESIQKYKERYRYVFADEYQDTDPIQHEFITSFENSNLFVVADALQAIYAFRGADSSIVKSLAEDEAWTTIKLYENYRSTVQICEYANNFSKYADDSYRIPLHAERRGPSVNIIADNSGPSWGGYVSNIVLKKLVDTYQSHREDSAILARTNAEVSYISEYLTSEHIEFVSKDDHDEASHILKSAADESFGVSWLASLLPASQYNQYIMLSTRYENSNSESYRLDEFLKEFGFVYEVSKRLDDIIAIQNILRDTPDLTTRISKISSKLNVSFDAVDEGLSDKELLLALADSVQTKFEDADLYVGTIHSVKGLEYENVYVVGVDGSTFPLNSEENKNLFYVAITRAKTRLTVFISKNSLDEYMR